MAVLRWGEFGEVAVRTYAQVKPGENLLIMADTWTSMEIAEACLVGGINAKAIGYKLRSAGICQVEQLEQ